MSSVFSKYVQSLSSEAKTLDVEHLGDILETLRGALVYGLKKRALWNVPPRYLGIYGGSNWDTGDALEELLLDCYQFIFVRRLHGLANQLETRSNIDGLIFLNIQHFLHDAQRRHDPLGYRIFEVVRSAVERLLADGVLHVLAGERKLGNDTVLGFAPWSDARGAHENLRELVEGWCGELMPDLAVAWSKEAVTEQMVDFLARLPADGVEVWRFGDLLRDLKRDVRARWAALMASAQGMTFVDEGSDERVAVAQEVPLDRQFEEQQSFQQLVSCIAKELGHLDETRKTRQYLRRLFQFLRCWAAESDRPPTENGAEEPLDGKLPSDKRLGELLDIPRGRVKDLRATLGGLVESCHGAGVPITGPSGPTQSRACESRREQLRAQTLRAARLSDDSRSQNRGAVRHGDTLVQDTADLPVDWVVIEIEPVPDGRLLVLAVDDRPFVGSRDVECGVVCVRCAQELWLDVAAVDPAQRTGRLDATTLERIRNKRQAIAQGGLRASLLAREVDSDSEYQSWMSRLDTARTLLRSRSVQEIGSAVPIGRARLRPAGRWSLTLAAVFASMVVGLSWWVQQLRLQVDELSQPFAIRSSATYDLRFLDISRTESLRLEATETHVVIYLVLSDYDAYPAYRLKLLAANGARTVWQSTAIAHDREIILGLPRRLLKVESYLLQLYGRDDAGDERLLAEQGFRIEVRQDPER